MLARWFIGGQTPAHCVQTTEVTVSLFGDEPLDITSVLERDQPCLSCCRGFGCLRLRLHVLSIAKWLKLSSLLLWKTTKR